MDSRPVVAGSDGSQESLRAVEWAAREAARRGVPLRIVSVTAAPPPAVTATSPILATPATHATAATLAGPAIPAAPAAPATPEEALRGIYAQSLRAVADDADETVPGLVLETELLSGRPGRTLVRDATGASLLVVGAQGVGGYDQPGLGQVSAYVARHAPCPIVVVRSARERGRPRGADGRASVTADGPIVVGVRDADAAATALDFAFAEAALRGAGLVAVHAWYWFPPALLSSSPSRSGTAASAAGPGHADGTGTAASRRDHLDARAMSAEAGQRLAAVLGGWRGRYPGVPVSEQVVHGHPAHVLTELTGDAGLLVLGRHDHRDGLRLGTNSVQHTVLSQSHGPVAVVPSA